MRVAAIIAIAMLLLATASTVSGTSASTTGNLPFRNAGDKSSLQGAPVGDGACMGWIDTPSPGLPESYLTELKGVAALAANDVWAVGFQSGTMLIEHWDGGQWSVVPPPYLVASDTRLNAVDGTGPNDVWAVGSYIPQITGNDSLILHWNGSSWSVVPSPEPYPDTDSQLHGVTALAENDAWAVGYVWNPQGYAETLIMHWDGSSWTRVPSPSMTNPGGNYQSVYYNYLTGVSAVSPDDIWAVGYYRNYWGDLHQSLALHWDGSEWTLAEPPGDEPDLTTLSGVVAMSADNVWAVGGHTIPEDIWGNDGNSTPLIEHWDGEQWSVVTGTVASGKGHLYGVDGASPNDLWAVGKTYDSSTREFGMLLAHWDGSSWSTVPGPSAPPHHINMMRAVDAFSSDDVWSVGQYQVEGVKPGMWHYTDICTTPTPAPTGTPGSIVPSLTPTPKLATSTPTPELATSIPSPDASFTVTPEPETSTPTPTQTPEPATSIPTPTLTQTPEPATSTPTLTQTPETEVGACELVFADVPAVDTFYSHALCLACSGSIGGYACGGPGAPCDASNSPYFRPGKSVSRGQIAKMVAQAGGFDEAPGVQIYEDVPPGSDFYDFVNRLAARGMISGYACGRVASEPCVAPDMRPYFRPGAPATRGQLSKIVANAAGLNEDPKSQKFEDVPPSNPFYVMVESLGNRNVVSGYPCGSTSAEPCGPDAKPYFRDNRTVTRGQAAKIVANAFFPGCKVLKP